jgi:hypothetical protein
MKKVLDLAALGLRVALDSSTIAGTHIADGRLRLVFGALKAGNQRANTFRTRLSMRSGLPCGHF